MRWYAKEPKRKPWPYDTRKRWRFALFPTRIVGNLTVWLEPYYAQQYYSPASWGTGASWDFDGHRFLKEHK